MHSDDLELHPHPFTCFLALPASDASAVLNFNRKKADLIK